MVDDEVGAIGVEQMAGVARTHAAFARSLFASLFVSDHAAALAGTQCPLLYVHGKVPADLQRLKELRPDATVERVVGCGHYLMLTAPDRVNAMIDTFLVSIASASLAG